MRSHYAITGAIRYYRTLPRQVELRKIGAVAPALKDRLACMGAMSDGDSDVLAIGEALPFGEGTFNFSRWKDTPYVELANLRNEPSAILRFTRTYGVLAHDYEGEARTIPVAQILAFRDHLRSAWDGDEKSLLELLGNIKADLWVRPAGLEIIPEDLWTLIRVIFARDMWDERTKKCQNPDCPAPYFLAVRNGQKFCSQKCAVLINVRLFREREARHIPKNRKQTKRKLKRRDGGA